MESYVPWLVYENVSKMLVKRGCILVNPLLPEADVVKKMVQPEYVLLHGRRTIDDPRGAADVVSIVIAPDSKVAKNAAHLKKAITDALALKKAAPMEILFITNELMPDRLIKQDDLYSKHVDVTLFNYEYKIFIVDITDHVSAPVHLLVPEAEITEFCKKYYTTRDKFSKIPTTDPQAVWLGPRPGMVVKILRASESAGIAPVYRVCVK
jgi:DNA-directed RNA polymerase subunit H